HEDAQQIVLQAGEAQAVFNKAAGTLVSFGAEGKSPILNGPLLNVWRAATDNDGIKLHGGQAEKALPRWLTLGFDKVKHTLSRIALLHADHQLPSVEIVHQASGRDCWSDFQHIHRYHLLP